MKHTTIDVTENVFKVGDRVSIGNDIGHQFIVKKVQITTLTVTPVRWYHRFWWWCCALGEWICLWWQNGFGP